MLENIYSYRKGQIYEYDQPIPTEEGSESDVYLLNYAAFNNQLDMRATYNRFAKKNKSGEWDIFLPHTDKILHTAKTLGDAFAWIMENLSYE